MVYFAGMTSKSQGIPANAGRDALASITLCCRCESGHSPTILISRADEGDD